MPSESINPTPKKINPNSLANLKPPFDGTFAGPGRPRLPKGEKERRAFLRAKIQEATPRAIEVLMDSLDAEMERDRIRAAEILVSHSLPRQEEVDLNESTNPFSRIEPSQLPELLRHIEVEVIDSPKDDLGSNGAGA